MTPPRYPFPARYSHILSSWKTWIHLKLWNNLHRRHLPCSLLPGSGAFKCTKDIFLEVPFILKKSKFCPLPFHQTTVSELIYYLTKLINFIGYYKSIRRRLKALITDIAIFRAIVVAWSWFPVRVCKYTPAPNLLQKIHGMPCLKKIRLNKKRFLSLCWLHPLLIENCDYRSLFVAKIFEPSLSVSELCYSFPQCLEMLKEILRLILNWYCGFVLISVKL